MTLLASSTLLASLVLLSSATAQADPEGPPNIPAPRTNLDASPAGADFTPEGELPLPYVPWRGSGPRPPRSSPAPDLPAPLARPRQRPRRPLELSAGLSLYLPSCGSGSLDDRGCLTVAPGSGAELALLYRVNPLFAFGGEIALSGFGGRGQGPLSRASGDARFFGVVGRVYFADDGPWDPYLALTLGTGTLTLKGDELADPRASTSGFGARVAGGVDYSFGSHFRVGPSASFAHWIAWSEERCGPSFCRDERAVYGRLLGFATLGLRVTGTWGDVL